MVNLRTMIKPLSISSALVLALASNQGYAAPETSSAAKPEADKSAERAAKRAERIERRVERKEEREERREERKEKRGVIEEVMVTAQKRTENIRDVPISITVLSDDFIQDASITDLNELSQFTPNLVINSIPYLSFITMRGLGSGQNKGFERSVALILDGIYYGRQEYIFEVLSDTGSVEVLRGPQGTLFGKNAIAGAINVSSAQPSDEFTGSISWLGGEFDRDRRRVAIGGPVIEDKLLARFYYEREFQEGGITNTAFYLDREENPHIEDIDEDSRTRINEVTRLSLAMPELVSNLDLKVSGTHARVFGNSAGAEVTLANDATREVYSRYDPEFEDDPGNQQNSHNAEEDSLRVGDSLTVQADYYIDDYVLTAVAGYSEFNKTGDIDADFGAINAVVLYADDDYEQSSLELRLASPQGETVEYVLGLYYLENEFLGFGSTDLEGGPTLEAVLAQQGSPATPAAFLGDLVNTLGIPLNSLPGGVLGTKLKSRRDFDQSSSSRAVFGNATWNVTDELALIFGARYSEEEKEVHAVLSHNNLLATAVFGQFLNEEAYNEIRERKETDFSPKFSIRYDVTEDITSYFTYARAFKGGGFNEAAVDASNLEFEPERAETYEAGLKMILLTGAARLNIGLFSTDFENLQISVFNGTQYVVGNAASAKSEGVEIEGQFIPRPWLAINASLAHLNSRYKSFPNAQCRATDSAESCDISGRELIRAPDWEASIMTRLDISGLIPALSDLPFKLGLGIDVNYRDEQYFTTDLDPLDRQDAATEVHTNLRLSDIDEQWHITLMGRNVTGTEIMAHSQDLPLQPGSHYGVMQPHERYFAEFVYNW